MLRSYHLLVGGRKPALVKRLESAINHAKERANGELEADAPQADAEASPSSQSQYVEQRIRARSQCQGDLLVGARLRGQSLEDYSTILHAVVAALPPPVTRGECRVSENSDRCKLMNSKSWVWNHCHHRQITRK